MVSAFGPLETAGPLMVWTIVLTFVFLECALIIGVFLPGDSMLVTAGIVLASHEAGDVQVIALSIAAMISAIAGNQVGYVIGQRTGSKLQAHKGARIVNAENLHRVNVFLEKHGFLGVLVARWIPYVRTLAPMVAGAAHMDRRKFTIASALGSIVWAPVILLLSYYFGTFLDSVPWLMPAVIIVLVVLLMIGTVLGIRHYLQEMSKPEELVEVEEA